MAESNKWVSFVTKLNDLTQKGNVQWRAADQLADDLRDTDQQRYSSVYATDIDGATVRIYQEKLKKMNWNEEEYWDDDIVIDILTTQGHDFVRVPYTPGQADLYETVVFRANRVDEFLSEFLKG